MSAFFINKTFVGSDDLDFALSGDYSYNPYVICPPAQPRVIVENYCGRYVLDDIKTVCEGELGSKKGAPEDLRLWPDRSQSMRWSFACGCRIRGKRPGTGRTRKEENRREVQEARRVRIQLLRAESDLWQENRLQNMLEVLNC